MYVPWHYIQVIKMQMYLQDTLLSADIRSVMDYRAFLKPCYLSILFAEA